MVLYIANQEYQTHFHENPPKKVHFYLYQICESEYFRNSLNDTIGIFLEESKPKIIDENFEEIKKYNNKIFLKIFLYRDEGTNTYRFPSAEVDESILASLAPAEPAQTGGDDAPPPPEDANAPADNDFTPTVENDETNDAILDFAVEKLASYIYSHNYIANYKEYYKGFIRSPDNPDECILIFDCTSSPVFSNPNMESCIIDEIINKKKILDTPVDPLVRKCFFEYKRWLYLTNEIYENLEIPQVFYYHTDTDDEIKRTDGEHGFFYYFDAEKIEMKPAKRYVCFLENSVYWNGGGEAAATNDENRVFDAVSIAYNDTKQYCNKIIGDYLQPVVRIDEPPEEVTEDAAAAQPEGVAVPIEELA